MSLYDYKFSLKLGAKDPPFYGLIMAALRKADDVNRALLENAYPEVAAEFRLRYHMPGGILPTEVEEGAVPQAVLDAIIKHHTLGNSKNLIDSVRGLWYSSTNDCYFVKCGDMTYGIEVDGYIHT